VIPSDPFPSPSGASTTSPPTNMKSGGGASPRMAKGDGGTETFDSSSAMMLQKIRVDGIAYHSHSLSCKWSTAPPCTYRVKENYLIGGIDGDLSTGQVINLTRALETYNTATALAVEPWDPPTLGTMSFIFAKVEIHTIPYRERKSRRLVKVLIDYAGKHYESAPSQVSYDGIAEWKGKNAPVNRNIVLNVKTIDKTYKPIRLTVLEYSDDGSNRASKVGEKIITDPRPYFDKKDDSKASGIHQVVFEVPHTIVRGGHTAICKVSMAIVYEDIPSAEKNSNMDPLKVNALEEQMKNWSSDREASFNYVANMKGQLDAEDRAAALTTRYGHNTSSITIQSLRLGVWFGESSSSEKLNKNSQRDNLVSLTVSSRM
jgi:hypothetical protein